MMRWDLQSLQQRIGTTQGSGSSSPVDVFWLLEILTVDLKLSESDTPTHKVFPNPHKLAIAAATAPGDIRVYYCAGGQISEAVLSANDDGLDFVYQDTTGPLGTSGNSAWIYIGLQLSVPMQPLRCTGSSVCLREQFMLHISESSSYPQSRNLITLFLSSVVSTYCCFTRLAMVLFMNCKSDRVRNGIFPTSRNWMRFLAHTSRRFMNLLRSRCKRLTASVARYTAKIQMI
jgi:hypothetical protein